MKGISEQAKNTFLLLANMGMRGKERRKEERKKEGESYFHPSNPPHFLSLFFSLSLSLSFFLTRFFFSFSHTLSQVNSFVVDGEELLCAGNDRAVVAWSMGNGKKTAVGRKEGKGGGK